MSTKIPESVKENLAVRAEKDLEPDPDIEETRAGSIQEVFEEMQAGEVVGHIGFVPHRFIEQYLMKNYEDDSRKGAQKIEELAEQLVDRILVPSEPGIDQQNVQMKLVQSVLQGAEVWIKREQGALSVSFRTQSDASNRFLLDRSKDLESELEQRLMSPIRVSVEPEESF